MRYLLIFILSITSPLTSAVQDAITLEVGVKTLVFHDVDETKILITEVYYPAEDGAGDGKTTLNIFDRITEARNAPILETKKKYPLIIFSHGQKGDRFSVTWLSTVLASYGYIVAAVDHFGSTWSNNNPEIAIKRWKRTEDITSLIDALLKDPVFGPHVDDNRIGMIGFSLGALTGVWLAGGISTQYHKPDLKKKNMIEIEEGLTEEMVAHLNISDAKKPHSDPRIKAFLLLSPVYGSSFDKGGLMNIKSPVLIMAAKDDKTAPLETNAEIFYEGIPGSSLILLQRGGHNIFLDKENGESISLEDRMEARKTIVKETLRFFDQTL